MVHYLILNNNELIQFINLLYLNYLNNHVIYFHNIAYIIN